MERKKILSDIKQAVLSIDPQAEIVLFGSRARGDYKEESDWDVLVLTDKDQKDWKHNEKIMNAVYTVELESNQIVTPIIRNKKLWEELAMTLFHKAVREDGIVI